MFDVGDEVYSKRFGEGVVMCVDDNALYIYPIHVQWKDSCKRDIFTPEGRYNVRLNDPDADICILKAGKFKVGDHVYSKHFGEGVVEHIDDPKTNTYPVQVYWIGACSRSFNTWEFYTPNGEFNTRYPQPDNDIIHMFKLQDRVFYPYYGKGTVVGDFKTDVPYPIRVFWDKPYFADEPYSNFSRDGHMSRHMLVGDENFKLKLLEDVPKEETGGSEMGQIAGVINYDIGKKMEADEEKRSPEGKKFKVGERVWSPYFGGGTVVTTESEAGAVFPIEVDWDDKHLGAFDYFTEDGKYTVDGENPERGIYHIDPEAAAKSLPNILHELGEDDDDESTVERMEDALNKKVEDAVNPSHYRVEGLPEAIDIINHLMNREQYEGFLWGNIIKYAYRYGRKGDKAETAGKIEWYAKQLKDLEEESYK